MGPELHNKNLIEILENNKKEKQARFENIVHCFTNMIDCAFNDATYDISSDSRYITVEGETQSPPTKYPNELLKSISNEIIRLRGFDQVRIYVYPGKSSNTSRIKMELLPKYESHVKGVVVDIVDHSSPDDLLVDRIIRSKNIDSDQTAIIQKYGLNHLG